MIKSTLLLLLGLFALALSLFCLVFLFDMPRLIDKHKELDQFRSRKWFKQRTIRSK